MNAARILVKQIVRIVFEMIGGPNDGQVLLGVLGEPSDAERYYLLSNRGAIGHRFKVASSFAVEMLAEEELQVDELHRFQMHYYVVTERLEEGGELRVRAQYVSESTGTTPGK